MNVINTVVNLTKKRTNYITTVVNLTKKKTIYKSYLSLIIPEYISSKSSFKEVSLMEEKLSAISKEDELLVIKYLLDIMKEHNIITEQEYHTVLYKYG